MFVGFAFAVEARLGGFSLARHGLIGLVWIGLAWLGLAWPGLAWPGLAWPGLVRLGLAWLGLTWLGLAWSGLADLTRPSPAWLDLARPA